MICPVMAPIESLLADGSLGVPRPSCEKEQCALWDMERDCCGFRRSQKTAETTDTAALKTGFYNQNCVPLGPSAGECTEPCCKPIPVEASALPQGRPHNKLQALADGIERDMKSTNGFITDGAGVVKSLRQIATEG